MQTEPSLFREAQNALAGTDGEIASRQGSARANRNWGDPHPVHIRLTADRRIENAPSFWRDRDGVSVVEFAFVLPVVVLLLGGIFQFGFALFMQGHISEIARETSRQVAVGEFTQSEAISFAQSSLINPGVTYDIAVTLPDPSDPNDRDVQVAISAPLDQLSPIDILGLFENRDLTASIRRRMEFTE